MFIVYSSEQYETDHMSLYSGPVVSSETVSKLSFRLIYWVERAYIPDIYSGN